jgi:hypothetical protein
MQATDPIGRKTMTVLLVMSLISAAAVTFLVCFFTALHNENTGRTGRVERISPAPIKWSVESNVLYLRPTSMGARTAIR